MQPVTEVQPVETWAFVNLSEPKQSKDKSLRKLVRSNAMRDYRQKRRQSQLRNQKQHGKPTARHHPVSDSSRSLTPTLPITTRHDDFKGYCIFHGHGECDPDCIYSSLTVRSSPKQLLGGGGTDPFNALPSGADRRYTGYVLSHCEHPSRSSLERT